MAVFNEDTRVKIPATIYTARQNIPSVWLEDLKIIQPTDPFVKTVLTNSYVC